MSKLLTYFPDKFSASMMGELSTRETSFFRHYIQHLNNNVRNPDLIAGGHIAKACEIVRTEFFNNGLDAASAIELGQDYILSSEDTGDSVKSNENVAFALGKYFMKFPLATSLPPCKLVDGTHAIEYKFDFDLGIPHPDRPDRNITFTGKLDYLCEKVELTKTTRYALDEKTCKSIFRLSGSKTIDYKKEADQYRTEGQLLAYSWAAKQLGVPINSFLIRRIPIMSSFEPSFELEIPITDFAIDLWFKSVYNTILALVEKYKLYKEFIEKDSSRTVHEVFLPAFSKTSCLSYSRTCRYIEGCISKEGEQMLGELFQQRLYDRDNRVEVDLETYLKGVKL